MANKKERKRKNLSGRFAVFFTILLLICTLIFLNSRFAAGSLRRLSYWIFNGVRGDATEAAVYFDANEYNEYSLLTGNLCVVSPQELSVYKTSGRNNFSEPVLLRNPAIATSKSRFIAYDLGGLNFYVADQKKILYSATSDSKITNINVNNTGDFSVISDGTDSKSLVTIYTSAFKPIYKFHSSEKYVFDAAVSKNAKEIAVLSYGTKSGHFSSSLSLARTNETGFYTTIDLGDTMPLKVSYQQNNKIHVICEDKFILFSEHGDVLSEISFNGLPLKSFSDSMSNRLAILLDDYKNGGNSRLLFIDENGQKHTELNFEEDVYSISCSGKYTSVQFAEKCVVYNADAVLHTEFTIPTTITECLVNNDSSVLSISTNQATVFIK